MSKILSGIYNILERLMIFMLALMTIFTIGNITVRYFGSSFSWIDEVSRLLFVWSSMLGIAFGYRLAAHPSFTLILDKLNTNNLKMGKALLLIINIMIIVFLFYLLTGGIEYINMVKMQRTSILGISVAWKYWAVPVATIMMIIDTIKNTFLLFNKEKVLI